MPYLGMGVGFLLIGLVVGYMVGGSASPVVGAAIPAVMGLVTAGVSMLTARSGISELRAAFDQVKDKLGDRTQADAFRERLVATAKEIARSAKATPAVLGTLTVLFVVGYGVGILAGTRGRLDGSVARVLSPLKGPWTYESEYREPEDLVSAMYWITAEQALRRAGVPPSTIGFLYSLYVQELDEELGRRTASGDAEPAKGEVAAFVLRTMPYVTTGAGTTGVTGPSPSPVVLMPVGPSDGVKLEVDRLVDSISRLEGRFLDDTPLPPLEQAPPPWVEDPPPWLLQAPNWLEDSPQWFDQSPGWLQNRPQWFDATPGWLERAPTWIEEAPPWLGALEPEAIQGSDWRDIQLVDPIGFYARGLIDFLGNDSAYCAGLGELCSEVRQNIDTILESAPDVEAPR